MAPKAVTVQSQAALDRKRLDVESRYNAWKTRCDNRPLVRRDVQELTPRERETLSLLLLAEGDYDMMASILCISPMTVKTHMNNLFQKLNVNTKIACLLKALREGLLEEESYTMALYETNLWKERSDYGSNISNSNGRETRPQAG